MPRSEPFNVLLRTSRKALSASIRGSSLTSCSGRNEDAAASPTSHHCHEPVKEVLATPVLSVPFKDKGEPNTALVTFVICPHKPCGQSPTCDVGLSQIYAPAQTITPCSQFFNNRHFHHTVFRATYGANPEPFNVFAQDIPGGTACAYRAPSGHPD